MDEITNLLAVNTQSGIPLIQQLKSQFTWLIVTGKLATGDRLPSVRTLADHLSININTVRSAYQRLESDNLVATHHGTGTIVLPMNISSIANKANRSRSNIIGVILPGLSDPFYHSLLQGIEEVNTHNQTMMLVCDAHEDPAEAYRIYTKLVAKQVDGIICASLPLGEFISKNWHNTNLFPLISVDWPDDQVNTVQIDLENAAYQAVRHLIGHGYKQIALVTLDVERANTLPLWQGYKHALMEAGMKSTADLITRVPGFSMEDGEIGALRILNQPLKPDAVIAISDFLALGIIKEFKSRGFRLPEDFAVIGMDDINLAGVVEPRLTTVSFPAKRLGAEAMKMLQNLIEGKKPDKDKVVLSTRLVIRDSCGCQTSR